MKHKLLAVLFIGAGVLLSGCSSYDMDQITSQADTGEQTRPRMTEALPGPKKTEPPTETTVLTEETVLEQNGERTEQYISDMKAIFNKKSGTVYSCYLYDDGTRYMEQLLFKDGASSTIYYDDIGYTPWKVDSRISYLQEADGTTYIVSLLDDMAVQWESEYNYMQDMMDAYNQTFELPKEYLSTDVYELDDVSYVRERFSVSKDNGREYTLDYMFDDESGTVRIILYNEAEVVKSDVTCKYSDEVDESLLALPENVKLVSYEELMSQVHYG